MTTTQMKSFLTAAEYLNFTKAAEQLYITQSALSKQIAVMEQEMGCKLFTRSNSVVSLTPQGKALFDGLSKIYMDYTELVATLRGITLGMSGGQLRIGIQSDQLMGEAFKNTMAELAHLRPDSRISIVRLSTQPLQNALVRREIDVTLQLFRNGIIPEQTEYYVYTKSPMYLAIPEKMLNRAGLSQNDFRVLLEELPLVLTHPDAYAPKTMPFIWSVLKYDIAKDNIRFEHDEERVMDLVSSGVYCTMANASHCLSQEPGICFVEAPQWGNMKKGLLWLKENDNPLLQMFLQRFRENSGNFEDQNLDSKA